MSTEPDCNLLSNETHLQMLIKRLDVTVQALLWSDRVQVHHHICRSSTTGFGVSVLTLHSEFVLLLCRSKWMKL